MSVSAIPNQVKFALWGQAAGRCEYRGCNRPLWKDDLTKCEFNVAYIAHIVADQPDGPRGDPIRSKLLCCDPANLMLMCDKHHRLIDVGDVEGHPESLLVAMKEEHELRIELATDVTPNMQSEIVYYGANVGVHPAPVHFRECADAMVRRKYPASSRGIGLGWTNSAVEDRRPDFWQFEAAQLSAQFQRYIAPRLADKSLAHVSIFAIAPQPLLMLLGYLLSELTSADVYQRRRDPQTWQWADNAADVTYLIEEPAADLSGPVAVVFSLSATVTDDRITAVLGEKACIWRVRIAQPNQDFLLSRENLAAFRCSARQLLDRIKARHGQSALLHVFPAMPVSAAVEFGRIIQPKADLGMQIYDQQQPRGFIPALQLNVPTTEYAANAA